MKLLMAFLFILLSSFTVMKKYIWIKFDRAIHITRNCTAQASQFSFTVTTNSKKPIAVRDFKLGTEPFKLYSNTKEINLWDTLAVSAAHAVYLTVLFKSSRDAQEPSLFTFKTNHTEHLNNAIELTYGDHFITSNDINKAVPQTIEVTHHCADSIKVYFPYGGTYSDVRLHKDSLHAKPCKYISYSLQAHTNYIHLTKADTGTYFVSFNACHWGNVFRMVVR
ncbi:MAG: hypothetical protein V4580_19990 [Bacteroidota bacterium]